LVKTEISTINNVPSGTQYTETNIMHHQISFAAMIFPTRSLKIFAHSSKKNYFLLNYFVFLQRLKCLFPAHIYQSIWTRVCRVKM